MYTDTDISPVLRFGRKTYDLSERTHIMGILNVTPDSFSDGGRYAAVDAAVARAQEMIAEGADLIDVGGESTRPRSTVYGEGADHVSVDEELGRVIPVIESLVRETDIPISVDTYKAAVAREALSAGAVIVNDISGFRADPAMPAVIAEAGASAVLMHIQGTPKTMQVDPSYRDLFGEIIEYLQASIAIGQAHAIRQMLIDPGIGFGKRLHHNLQLLANLHRLRVLGYPVLVGASRKSFLGSILDLPVNDRLEGSLAACVAAILNGAQVIRVHDVRESKRAAMVADAIRLAAQ
ncbi:MAG: dihydropteroate synthase [Ignavibacteria bacterium]|nr:dihydropteroate synthase [Ignavibacteria bacterium]